ncbi:ribosome biogenesis GTP-binding protein YihA/YsxC [Candidatus Photodesmus blepharus]|uniref:ribosome biogenesis GTP-binding protein YihA/YsxC n=1 Tax=Candidatus Photodesmus blepharonis TaxID=1179155 RepID=UPI00054EC49F|nr:ribosome biogenesis GTP-binding protein YihA/YsxC [Candidatus Photodesmus blepharus]
MSVKIHYPNTRFILSAPSIYHLPKDKGIEVAFFGRSNAGKSSSLNCLTNQRNLAKISKTPGCTQLINLFKVYADCRIVDVPGYGFARVPLSVKGKWQKSLEEYIKKRRCLKGLVILMDIRHPLKSSDKRILLLALKHGVPVQILLSKADKLKNSMRKFRLLNVRSAILNFGGDIKVDVFSSRGYGIKVLRDKLDTWFSPYFLKKSK